MTAVTFSLNGRTWTLTDEHSQSSYGEPVLVSDDGIALHATDIAIPAEPNRLLGIGERPALSGYDVVMYGRRNDGKAISRDDWPAVSAMMHRYVNQWRRFQGLGGDRS